MRLFVAISLPEEISGQIEGIPRKIRTLDLQGSLVAPGNLHITLKFIGQTEERRVSQIRDGLSEVGRNRTGFSLSLRGVHAFPSPRRPRVIAIRIGPSAELADLKHGIDDSLGQLGWPAERRTYRPHLTLMRLKGRRNLEGLQEWLSVPNLWETVQLRVRDFGLYRSHLSSQGARYERLHRIGLKSP